MQILVGKHFRLRRPVNAVVRTHGVSVSEVIPENSIVIVEVLYDGDRLLRVRYNGHEMFILSEHFLESGRPFTP